LELKLGKLSEREGQLNQLLSKVRPQSDLAKRDGEFVLEY
jgi:hypothetical protein